MAYKNEVPVRPPAALEYRGRMESLGGETETGNEAVIVFLVENCGDIRTEATWRVNAIDLEEQVSDEGRLVWF